MYLAPLPAQVVSLLEAKEEISNDVSQIWCFPAPGPPGGVGEHQGQYGDNLDILRHYVKAACKSHCPHIH